MTSEQINALAKYLGCKCDLYWNDGQVSFSKKLGTLALRMLKIKKAGICNMDLKPLSSLTQEDFDRMCDEVSWFSESYDKGELELKRWESNNPHECDLHWNEADWLRNNGYYLGEESIKEFVKLKK